MKIKYALLVLGLFFLILFPSAQAVTTSGVNIKYGTNYYNIKTSTTTIIFTADASIGMLQAGSASVVIESDEPAYLTNLPYSYNSATGRTTITATESRTVNVDFSTTGIYQGAKIREVTGGYLTAVPTFSEGELQLSFTITNSVGSSSGSFKINVGTLGKPDWVDINGIKYYDTQWDWDSSNSILTFTNLQLSTRSIIVKFTGGGGTGGSSGGGSGSGRGSLTPYVPIIPSPSLPVLPQIPIPLITPRINIPIFPEWLKDNLVFIIVAVIVLGMTVPLVKTSHHKRRTKLKYKSKFDIEKELKKIKKSWKKTTKI